MSMTEMVHAPASPRRRADHVDAKLEVLVIPVSDIDRAKRFYGGLGWRLDVDYAPSDDHRVIQFTPPGSGCSVIFGKNLTEAAPGSAQRLHLIVSDIEAACDQLLRRGIEIGGPLHDAGGIFHHARGCASFSDPDGNGWIFQEAPARQTGQIAPDDTGFTPQLADVRRAEAAAFA